MLTPAHTRSCFEWTFMFIHLPFPLLRDMTKLEVRSLASMCSNILNTSPLLTSRHVCPFTRYRIPVSPWLSHNASGQTIMKNVIPSGPEVNISSSWRRKSQSRAITVTRHTIWCTQNSPYHHPVTGRFVWEPKYIFLREATRYSHGLWNFVYKITKHDMTYNVDMMESLSISLTWGRFNNHCSANNMFSLLVTSLFQ